MKKIALLSAFTVLAVILSCTKQPSEMENLMTSSDQMAANENDTEQRILSFKESISGNLKHEGDLSIDDAVWNIEALANYEYADVSFGNLPNINWDSAFISVSLTGGKVTINEAASVYEKVIDSLRAQYQGLPANSHLIFVDIFSKDSTASNVTFGMIVLQTTISTIT